MSRFYVGFGCVCLLKAYLECYCYARPHESVTSTWSCCLHVYISFYQISSFDVCESVSFGLFCLFMLSLGW